MHQPHIMSINGIDMYVQIHTIECLTCHFIYDTSFENYQFIDEHNVDIVTCQLSIVQQHKD